MNPLCIFNILQILALLLNVQLNVQNSSKLLNRICQMQQNSHGNFEDFYSHDFQQSLFYWNSERCRNVNQSDKTIQEDSPVAYYKTVEDCNSGQILYYSIVNEHTIKILQTAATAISFKLTPAKRFSK